MSLSAIVDRVERRQRRLVLVSPPSRAVVSAVERTFAPQGVRVHVEEGTDRPTAVVRDGDEVVSIVPLDGTDTDGAGLEATTDALTSALSMPERTTFASYDLRAMFAATREIEDRAWRARRGRLRAGFQRVRALHDQRAVYTQLATTLDVHTYAIPDGPTPDMGNATLHLHPSRELERAWFVVYDGGGQPANKCALLAEERGDRRFTGFLTYAPELVDEIDTYLAEAY